MIGSQSLTATAQSFPGGRRLTLDFVAFLLVGVVFFPIFSHRGSCVFP